MSACLNFLAAPTVPASDHAAELFTPGRTVTLEFEGNEPVAECLQLYRDNFGRLLV